MNGVVGWRLRSISTKEATLERDEEKSILFVVCELIQGRFISRIYTLRYPGTAPE